MFSRQYPGEVNGYFGWSRKGIENVEPLPDLLQAAKRGRAGRNAPINRKWKGTCLGSFLRHGVHEINIGHFLTVSLDNVARR